jgi:hypothetical protein
MRLIAVTHGLRRCNPPNVIPDSPRRPIRWHMPRQVSAGLLGLPDQIGGERCFDRRYGIVLELRWKLLRRKRTVDSGHGHTVDLSSGGILFETGRQLPVARNVELSIVWPVLLHDSLPLQLVVAGRVLRSDSHRTAILIGQHEFRTVGLEGGSLAASCGRRSHACLAGA